MKVIGEIKVDKKIKPINFKERVIPELVIGGDYFVSFGCNVAEPCKIIEIDFNSKRLTIETINKRGKRTNIINFDEIGATPEQSITNEVTL